MTTPARHPVHPGGLTVASPRHGRTLLVAGLAVAGLTVVSVVAVGGTGDDTPVGTGCAAPADLPGTLLTVTAWDMGGTAGAEGRGPMMAEGTTGGSMMGGVPMPGSMRLTVDRAVAPAGVVSIVASDVGVLVHEVVVLPLGPAVPVGTRTLVDHRTVDESRSLGEASSSCTEGGGSGIDPGTTGWVTTTLAAGRYELVCNLPGHYGSGMRTLLTVT